MDFFSVFVARTINREALRGSLRAFTLTETLVALGLCSMVLSVFYVTVAQGLRIVKNASEQAAASQFLEQRLETLRARPFWSNVVTISGVRAALAEELPSGTALADVSESCSVGPDPGEAVAFTVTRRGDGTTAFSGTSLPSSQTSVRVVYAISWGAPPQVRRTRTVATIFTKGGL